jgi:hypothetical protein
MRNRIIAATAAAALALVPAAAFAQDGTAEVVAVHGIPQSIFDTLGADSTAVDVYVAGSYDDALLTFEFGDVGSVDVPAGAYDLEVYAAGSDPEAGDPVLALSTPSLSAGASASVVAHLDADGAPTLQPYINETDGTGIQVFHTAAFGAVDIIAGGEAVLEGVTNGQTARVDVPGGTTVPGVGVAPAGGEVALDLGDVTVPEDTLVLAYAIGSADDESLQVVTGTTAATSADDNGDDNGDTSDDGADTDDDAGATDGERPTAVHSGSGGLAADGLPLWIVGLMALGALTLASPALAVVRSRR